MKRTIFYLIGLVLFISCSSRPRKNTGEIKMLQYRTVGQFMGNNGEVVSITSNVGIVFYGDLRLYITRMIRNLQIQHMDKFRIDTVFQYHIIKKGRFYGLQYNSLNTDKGKVFNLDSLLKYKGMDTEALKFLSVKYGTPSEVVRNPHDNSLEIEKFAVPVSTGGSDSIYRYYDIKLKNLDFSLSTSLDMEKGSKLVKTVFVDAPRPKGKHPFDFPKMVFQNAISVVPITDPDFYINIFDRYLRESKGMNLK